MKLAIATLSTVAALALGGLTWISCSVPNKSGEYECATQADCAAFPGRVCTGGYCVTGDTPLDGGIRPIDAPGPRPIDAPPASVCPSQCTSCDAAAKFCAIDCSATVNGCMNAQVVCPTGWTCEIGCNRANACSMGVNCTQAAACEIDCSGEGSCQGLASGPGPFVVACGGQNSCRGVNCDASCACDVECKDGSACEFLRCSKPTCGMLPRGCTSQRVGCDECP